MAARIRTAASVTWLALKVAALLLLMYCGRAAFVYQNF